MQFEATENGLKAVLRNELTEIRGLADAIETLVERLNIPSAVVHKITLAADELITNVISYGLPESESRVLHVEVAVVDDSLQIEIVDDGPPFDPFTETAEPDIDAALEDRPIGGLGIHFVRTLLDRTSYNRSDGRNHVTLSASLRPRRDQGATQ